MCATLKARCSALSREHRAQFNAYGSRGITNLVPILAMSLVSMFQRYVLSADTMSPEKVKCFAAVHAGYILTVPKRFFAMYDSFRP
jgi:hypothetical protein